MLFILKIPPGLWRSKKLVNMGWLIIIGVSQIDGRSPLIDQLPPLTYSGAWASSEHSPPSSPSWEDTQLWESSFLSNHTAFLHPRHPCPSIMLSRILIHEKWSAWLSRCLYQPPATLSYLSPLCMHQIYSQYIWGVKCTVPKNVNKNTKNMIE